MKSVKINNITCDFKAIILGVRHSLIVGPILFSGFFNTLTADGEFCRYNRENLPLPIQMQLSKKPKVFCCIFITLLESTLNLEHFEGEKKKKKNLIAYVFLKLLTPKDMVT